MIRVQTKAHLEMEFRAMTRKPSHLTSESHVAEPQPTTSRHESAPNGTSRPDPPVDLRQWEQVLSLWLEWNEVDERLTESLFTARSDPEQIEAILDQADRLRERAVELSRQLLATGHVDL